MIIPTTKFATFRELEYGSLFYLLDTADEDIDIWCKTPCADMMEYNNNYSNADGAFCTAICITSEKQRYMQCCPDARVVVIDTKKALGMQS